MKVTSRIAATTSSDEPILLGLFRNADGRGSVTYTNLIQLTMKKQALHNSRANGASVATLAKRFGDHRATIWVKTTYISRSSERIRGRRSNELNP